MDVSATRHSLLPPQVPALRIAGAGRGLSVPEHGAPLALDPLRDGVLDGSRGVRIGPGSESRAAGELGPSARDAGEKLESLFATMLVKELRKALPDEGFFGSGPGADVFNGWLDEFLGEQLARDGALGLAGRVETALAEREGEQNDGTQEPVVAPRGVGARGDHRPGPRR